MNFDIPTLQQALLTLYGSSSTDEKNSANDYLLKFQRSLDAWDIVFPILSADQNSTSYPLEMRIFAAQTLRSKVHYDLGQVHDSGPDSTTSLRNSILTLLSPPNSHHKLVIVQLSLALAYLAIQDLNWPSPIEDVANALQNSPIPLLNFLAALPEELADHTRLPLSHDDYDKQYTHLLTNNAQTVYTILSNLCTIIDDKSTLLDTIKSWSTIIPLSLFVSNDSPLWNIITSSFNNPSSFESATTTLTSIIASIDTNSISDNLIEIILNQLVALKPLVKQFAEEEDTDALERIADLYATAGESWHLLIVKQPERFSEIVRTLLDLTAVSTDLEIVQYTFKFWYEIKSVLMLNNFAHARSIFKPIYVQLVHILLRHLTYPTTSDSTDIVTLFANNREEMDKFKDFRYAIGDVLKDCCQVIGYTDALNIPFVQLQQISPNSPWQNIECLLFAIRSMAKEVPISENTVLPQIMTSLIELPENSKVRYAATLVLGRYTTWTAAHPDLLPLQLNYIISGLSSNTDTDVIIATAHALKYFCLDCSQLLADHVDTLYSVYTSVDGRIDSQSTLDIAEGLAYVVKNIIDTNIIANENRCVDLLRMFLTPTLTKLTNNSANEDILSDALEQLTVFIDALRIPDAILDLRLSSFRIVDYLLAEVFPSVYAVIETHGGTPKIAERASKLIRKSILNFKRYFINALPTLTTLLTTAFRTYHHGCYLWASAAIVREFTIDDESYEVDEPIKLSKETLSAVWSFAVNQIYAFVDIYSETTTPDIIEDFYRLLGDVLMFKTLELLERTDMLTALFNVSLTVLTTSAESGVHKYVLEYLIDLFSWCLESPPVSIFFEVPLPLRHGVYTLLIENEFNLLDATLMSALTKFNEDMSYLAVELFMVVIKVNSEFGNSERSNEYIQHFLTALPSDILSNAEKNSFFTSFTKAMGDNNPRKMRSALIDFIHWYKRKIINRGD
ncbi:hypothetical protein CANINC_005028 [Pichia inconspicua]|uniref:Exportin-1/Importin-beta-like domain-containing protein n=1 Tax=Pichia inconspicua TaxID=52247 RepID=A0A4T0WUQ7_9ASCO|nr:hypothetical protein CANINC_005028 [[Candida] inconspicua]